MVENKLNATGNDVSIEKSAAEFINENISDGQKKMSPLLGNGSPENSLQNYDNKNQNSDDSTTKNANTT